MDKTYQDDKNMAETSNWKRFYLRHNEAYISKFNIFSTAFLQTLRDNGSITEFYYKKSVSLMKQEKASAIFDMPFVQGEFYNVLTTELQRTNKSAPHLFLIQGYNEMEKWTNPNSWQDATDYTALVKAIGNGCSVSLLEYTKHKPLLLQSTNDGYNLLHAAAECGHTDAIKYLISIGLGVNSKTEKNSTPLHYLCRNGGNAVEVTKLLLASGADLCAKDSDGQTVAFTVCNYLSSEEYHNWVEFMIREGHDNLFSHKDNNGDTPLHYALLHCDVSTATLRLFGSELHFDFNSGGHYSSTLLMCAAVGGQGRAVLECLVELGADWTKKNNYGRNALHSAVAGGNIEGVKYLISLGMDANCTDDFMGTPLHHLHRSYVNHIEITKVFVDHNANLLARSNSGDTIAHPFGRDSDYKSDYVAWKEYMKSIGNESIFATRNNQWQLPN